MRPVAGFLVGAAVPGDAPRHARRAAGPVRAALALLVLPALAGPACADRIFYRAGTWLETSPAVQRLSLEGVLRGWERMASEVEEAAMRGDPLTRRQREALRLTDCLAPRASADLLERVTVFAAAEPGRVFYSLSDFLAESLKALCPAR